MFLPVPVTFFDLVLFALVGLGIEVVFTALSDRKKDLMGYSSVWYVPSYAILPIVFGLIYQWFFLWPWFARGLVYWIVGQTGEYMWMWVLRKLLGKSPSEEEYYRSGRSIHGLIRWDYAPVFVVVGFLFELLFRLKVL